MRLAWNFWQQGVKFSLSLSLRRNTGEFIDDWPYSDAEEEDNSSQTADEEDEENNKHEGSDVRSVEMNDHKYDVHNALAGDTCDSDSSLDENVEVGDIAEIVGLTLGEGKASERILR